MSVSTNLSGGSRPARTALLGVEPIINANTTLTMLGGSLMPEPVIEAMRSAAADFVDVDELMSAAGQRLAELTRNEAAYVSSGAAAGLTLAALGAMTGADPKAAQRKADGRREGALPSEIVVQTAHRNPYDRMLMLAGARIISVGSVLGTSRLELESALTDRTAAVFHFAGAHLSAGSLPLAEVIEVAHAVDVPVVVDAAAQLPPTRNLWAFTEAGADLALFSGGKGLRGPAPTGLMVGRAELIRACALHGYPNQRMGRPMKVGKEEIMGLVAAVEWFLEQDHEADAQRIELATAAWIDVLGQLPGVHARRDYPGEAGRPVARAVVTWTGDIAASDVRTTLRAGNPRIDVALRNERSIYLSAELLTDEQVDIVAASVSGVLSSIVSPR